MRYNPAPCVEKCNPAQRLEWKGEAIMSSNRLTISFWIWGPFDTGRGVYHDVDAHMAELVRRGFNCIRMESCAGLLCAPDGTPRGPVMLHAPFGQYTPTVRQLNVDPWEGFCDVSTLLIDVFRAADRHNVRIILSSWYFLHTNWFLDEEINRPLFEMTADEVFDYFTDELDRILSLLRRHNLIHCVAFAELFNEFNGISLTCAPEGEDQAAHDVRIRRLHEQALRRLKRRHPDVLFAYDTDNLFNRIDLIPRNADVINFHSYYLWDVYAPLEHGAVSQSLEEAQYAPETLSYLLPEKQRVRVSDVIAERRGNTRTGRDWNSRVSLYASLDPARLNALEKRLDDELAAHCSEYFSKLQRTVRQALFIRDQYLPAARLVMGEGVAYCCAQNLLFEEHCDTYWELLAEQARLLRDSGLWGAVVRTTSGPEDPSWTLREDDYRRLNALFSE